VKITKTRLLEIIKEELQIVVEKKKKKSSGKKDACYHKVRARYDVWPSAYASGALVKCRKVGAANWGKTTTKEGRELYEAEEGIESMIRQVLMDEGGAAGIEAIKDFLAGKNENVSEETVASVIDEMPDVGQHKDGDYILQDNEEIKVKSK
jgi:hypothetical protein